MIRFENICKTFKVARREPGFKSAVKSLVRREYTYVEALKDVSFSVGRGEAVGYIGPNGAGKSTTIKIMCGILTPDSGMCEIDGRIPWRDRVAHVREIGVVFGQRSQLWWDVPAIDSFQLIRDIYRVQEKVYKANLDELTTLLDSLRGLRRRDLEIFNIRGAAGAVPVLPAFIFTGQNRKCVLYVHSAVWSVVFAPMLRVFQVWAAEV